jgi:threonine aldolase
MFLPTGTLANHLALRTLAGTRRRVLVQAESHFYNDSGDAGSTLSDLNLIPLAPGRTGFTLAQVQDWMARSAGGRVPLGIGAISIESPVRRRDHEYVDPAELQRICTWARAHGVGLHLDGARLFNLPLHTGQSLQQIAAMFDTVMVSVWKHFNGKAGAILAGEKTFIEGLYHQRRMFGGSLPQAWPTVAPALKYLDSYERDYAQAWQAAEALIARLLASGKFRVRRLAQGTSRFFLSPTQATPEVLVQAAAAQGVLLPGAAHASDELALQVNPSLLRRPVEDIVQVLINGVSGS